MSQEQQTGTNKANQEELPSFPFPFADHSLNVPAKYAQLRQQCPVARVHMPYSGDALVPTRYEEIAQGFANPKCDAIRTSDGDVPRLEAGNVTGTEGSETSAIFAVSDARHNKLRRVVAPAFTVQASNKLRPRVVEVTNALIDEMERKGPPADLFEDYAIQVPMTVLCEMLGIPQQEEHLYRESARIMISTTALAEEKRAQSMKLMQYLAPIIQRARENPEDNVLGLLVKAQQQGDEVMTESEMYGFAMGIIGAGFETVSTTFTNSAFILLQQPELVAQLRTLLEQPDQLANAIEEILRVTPIGAGRPRITREPVQLGETAIPAGEVLFLVTHAANYDPSVFPDARAIRFDRELHPIMSFGRGIHACLGQQTARMELQVLWQTLLARLPSVRLAVPPSEVPWRADETLTFGPAHLPVTW
ncbi:cytochrome P450 [Reticulibacter mediterranei]|uniref:Cytochrome P450 n=1 Tax=Reticulibacter mediterranei TaxID=2778369 RepID=A0A8J3IPP8_9CHLR|nr:cytochrome P450 [Reticulibacter mediterranei]GHO99659.1 cytochrome P450 [Reticulibacter mediterranei]